MCFYSKQLNRIEKKTGEMVTLGLGTKKEIDIYRQALSTKTQVRSFKPQSLTINTIDVFIFSAVL